MAIQRVGHIGICVSSLERSVPFYRDLLGFRAMTQTEVRGEDADKLLGLSGVDQTTVFLERDGVRLALFEFRSPAAIGGGPREMNRLGLAAIMLRVDDLEATLDTLRAAGVHVLEDTRTDYAAYNSSLVFVTDPDGTMVELVQIPGDLYTPFGKPSPA